MFNSKSFGVVIYMDEKMYTESKKQNMNIHFPISKEEVVLGIIRCLYDINLGKYEVENIVIGHEHGEEIYETREIYY